MQRKDDRSGRYDGMTVIDNRELIGAGSQPMKYKVTGCIARRARGLTIRSKFDDGSARGRCCPMNEDAIP